MTATVPAWARTQLSVRPLSLILASALLTASLAHIAAPALAAPSPLEAVLHAGGVLILGSWVEQRLGIARLAVVIAAAVGAAILLGGPIAWAADRAGNHLGWFHTPTSSVISLHPMGPLPWIIALALTATLYLSTLWRRRIRLALVTTVLAAVLYLGHRGTVEIATGALLGYAVALWVTPMAGAQETSSPIHARRREAGTILRSPGVSLRERRTLVAVIIVAIAVGPVVARMMSSTSGLLSPVGELLGKFTLSPADVAQLCSADSVSRACMHATARLRHTGVGPVLSGVIPTVMALIFANGLRRGRAAARWGAVAVFAAWALAALTQLVMYLVTGSGFFGNPLWLATSMIPLLAALGVLLAQKPYFSVRISAANARRFGRASVVTLLVGWAGYVAGGLLLADGFAARPSMWALIADFPRRLVPPRFLGTMEIHAALSERVDIFATTPLPVSTAAGVLYEWTGIAVWAVLAVIAWKLIHAPAVGHADADRDVIKDLLRQPGGGNLSWMATWDDNSYWISADRRAAVAYRNHNGIHLSVGDPIACAAQRGPAALAFADHALEHGATGCLYSVSEDTKNYLEAHGWHSLQVAEETVIELPELEFRGKKFQDVRTALNRARKEEIAALWTTWNAAALGMRDQITAISEAWVADQGLPELGFTLGGLAELNDPEVRLLLAVDAQGTVHGVTSWMPVYRDGKIVGLTLDFMRRRTEGFRPVMEFLIASAALAAKDEGLEFLSLSGAPLAHSHSTPCPDEANPNDEARLLDRALDRLSQLLEPVYGFRSLLAFKAKFQPVYRPLYVCYEDPGSLAAIGAAVTRAYLGPVGAVSGMRMMSALRKPAQRAAHPLRG